MTTPMYYKDASGELWWCNSHRRRATHLLLRDGFDLSESHCCDPNLGGILLPCMCVNLTRIAELVETP
jgi:hypothetical protein